MCKSLIAVNMSLPLRKSNNVLMACQIRNWFWNCFNEAMNKFAGPWPSERSPQHRPRSPAVALLTIHKWEWGHRERCCLVAKDLQALSWDFVPCSHLWSPLHFRFVLRCVFVHTSLPAAFPGINTSNWKGWADFSQKHKEGLQIPSCSLSDTCGKHS